GKHSEEMFLIFPIVQQLHEMLVYLNPALTLKEAASFHDKLQLIYKKPVDLPGRTPQKNLKLDLISHRRKVKQTLIAERKNYRGRGTKQGKKGVKKKKLHLDFFA
ncbi:hypothetical protein ACEF17_12535, partial [Streptococcus hyovaginalis]